MRTLTGWDKIRSSLKESKRKRVSIRLLDSRLIMEEAMTIAEDTKKIAFRESRLRSLVKSLGYRIISTAGTGILTWIITRDIRETVSITLIIQVFLVILYYSYERIWIKINWGRKVETI